MFRRLHWVWTKARVACSPLRIRTPSHVQVRLVKGAVKSDDFPPNAEPYAELARFWSDFAVGSVARYDRLLAAAKAYYDQPITRILDLACGTGLISRQLARQIQTVVGLDASETMLAQARRRTHEDNIRFVQGDFRHFRLGEVFDAAVCGGDSLNYLERPEELVNVFCCVHEHLRPGGLFCFDVLNHQRFLLLARRSVQASVGETRLQIHFCYDPSRRVSESRVVVGKVIERHRRIPLEEEDVAKAAHVSGLTVVEHFSADTYVPVLQGRQFYVLKRPER